MDLIASINSAINGFVWGVPMLVLLVGTGILMTLRTRGVQFRKFGYAMKNTIGKSSSFDDVRNAIPRALAHTLLNAKGK